MSTITNTGSGLASNYTIFGVTFNIKLAIFILGSIAFGIGGIMYFNSSQQYIGMALFIPLTVLILIVYGNRWFGPTGSATIQLSSWPPQINSCPDFLTAYAITIGTGTSAKKSNGCVDLIGVSTNNGFDKITDPATLTSSNDNLTDNKFFKLQSGETRKELCARLVAAGLTWEGVNDGVSCLEPDGSGTTLGANSKCQ